MKSCPYLAVLSSRGMSEVSLGICRPYESKRLAARVLIVDADRKATEKLAGLLWELGCDVSYALDARLALLFGKRCKPHVVFLDLATPHVKQLDLARAFREESCAVIALCASVDEERAGFDGFVGKPVRLQVLEPMVRPFLPVIDDPEVTPLLV
jgi:DNA-binding response OmpR family regulator